MWPGLMEQFAKREIFGDELVAILPAGLVQVAPGAAKLWCVARSLDHPENRGNGCGIISLTLDELASWLKRSTRTVWRYLQEALKTGFIHRHWWQDDRLHIEYTGLKRLAKKWGLQSIGAVGMFPLHDIQHAKTKAAEIQAEDLQRQSDYKRKEEWGKYAKGSKSAAELLMGGSSSSARVSGGERITRGNRLLYLAPHWRPFGGSQKTIGDRIGVSTRTVQNRLSNSWRRERGIEPIDKAQSAVQVFEEMPLEMLHHFIRREADDKRFVFLGRRCFRVGCNLYKTSVLLRNHRYRKAEFQKAYYKTTEAVAAENREPADTTGDYSVCDEEFKSFSELQTSLPNG